MIEPEYKPMIRPWHYKRRGAYKLTDKDRLEMICLYLIGWPSKEICHLYGDVDISYPKLLATRLFGKGQFHNKVDRVKRLALIFPQQPVREPDKDHCIVGPNVP